MSFQEKVFNLRGQDIAAKIWNEGQGLPILALHGWLDNAGSFDKLAPLIPHHIVAIDFPGHGLSDHKPINSVIHLIDYVIDAISVTKFLGWKKYVLLGHSMGAAICSLIAGCMGDSVQAALLIDGLGPMPANARHAPKYLRMFLDEREAKPDKKSPRYESPLEAIDARLKVTPMELESVKCLIHRGLKQLSNGKWAWRTDPRLLMHSAQHLTEDQILAFLNAISAPVCVIRPIPGYPFPPEVIMHRLQAIKHAIVHEIPGHHHVHLDSPEVVAECLNNFLTSLALKRSDG